MGFIYKAPIWNAEGVEPDSNLQKNGFQAGYKPPAEYFNYMFHRYTECIEELQDETENLGIGYITENLIPYPYFHKTKTLNGVTFTDNGDGTITLNGTNTGDNDADFAIFRGDMTLKAGTYVFSGAPEGSAVDTYFLQIADEDWSYSINSYGEKVINVSEDRVINRIRIVVKSGVTLSNVKFKPMLEFGDVAHDYVPYIESRQGLREEIANAKDNLFPYPYAEKSKTLNGITFTDRGDGTILVNGTATAEATYYISMGLTLKAGVYSFSGCPNTTCKIQIASSDWTFNRTDSGKGRTFVLAETSTFSQVRISVPSGVTVTNEVFKPMLVEGDTIPTKHKVSIDPVRKTISYACGDNTTVLDIVNAYNNKVIGIGERLSLGTYGNFDYSYGYGILLRAVFDTTLQSYVVKMFIWDDADETTGILYGKSEDGSLLLKDAEHYTFNYGENGEFLPLTGGTLTGDFTIEKKQPTITLSDTTSGRQMMPYMYNGVAYIRNALDSKNRSVFMLGAETSDIEKLVRLATNISGTSTYYSLFGEHNKPNGNYTGNGDSAERQITIGGIGKMLLITSEIGFAIVTTAGAWGRKSTTTSSFYASECELQDGILILNTTDTLFNQSGTTYYWQLI